MEWVERRNVRGAEQSGRVRAPEWEVGEKGGAGGHGGEEIENRR